MSTKTTYREFCLHHPVPLFFQPFWLDASGMSWDVCVAEQKGYKAFWIYHRYTKLGLSFIRNAHLTPYTGLLLADPSIPLPVTQALISELISKLPKTDVIEVDLPLLDSTVQHVVGCDLSFRHTNLLDLGDMNTVFKRFKPALKRQVKKAEKNLLIWEIDDIELFYRLHKMSFEKQNSSPHIPLNEMSAYWNCCKKNQAGRLFFIGDHTDAVHAALWLAFDADRAYYLAGGTDHAHYGSGAMSLLMCHAIRESKQMGKQIFDFEGSMRPSVDRFFKNFSPQEVHYIHLERIRSGLYKLLKK